MITTQIYVNMQMAPIGQLANEQKEEQRENCREVEEE